VPISDWKKLFVDCEYPIILKENLFGRYFDRWLNGGAPMNIPSTDQAFTNNDGGVGCPQENLVMCYPWSNGEPIDPNSEEYRKAPFYGLGSENGGHDRRDKRFYLCFIFNGAVHQHTTTNGRNVEIWHTSDMENKIIPKDMPGQNLVTGACLGGRAETGYYDIKNYSMVARGSGTRYFNRMETYARLAEIYLWYAEAANRVWGPTGAPQGTGVSYTAMEALNKVRVRAELPPISPNATEPWLRPGNTQEFEKVIRNEIRIETALEEKRYYDLVRWRIMQDENVKVSLGMWVHQNADGTFTYAQRPMGNRDRWTDKWLPEKHYLFRIPITETRLGGKFKQNPGW